MTWPVLNIVQMRALKTAEGAAAAAKEASAKAGPVAELLGRHLRLSTYLFFTLLTLWAGYGPGWEARAAALEPRWVLEVLARNLAVEWVCYGGWHLWLYGGLGVASHVSGNEAMQGKKFNAVRQYAIPSRHLHREMAFTTLGFAMSSAYEVGVFHLLAKGTFPMLASFWSRPLYSLFHLLFVGYWRDFHFFFCHRLMHPWFAESKEGGFGGPGGAVPDLGRFLYNQVHSLHHKSYNPGPFSGLSMHPVEHLLYYTCTLLCLLWPLHPAHFLFNKFHADLSPLPGHDGYDKPGGGSYFHYLHHAHYDCNYGTPMVPLDQLFGSYQDGSKWEKKKTTEAAAAAGKKVE